MFARLWWKDLRQFGPAWAAIGLATAGGMALAARWVDELAPRASVVSGLALMAPCLYAMAVGAAAFAGEREAGMLRWLDTLPAPRRAVWGHKAGFALASAATLSIGLGIMALALIGENRLYRAPGPVMVFVLVLAAACWGLLASAVARSVLVAGVAGVALFLVVHLSISNAGAGSNPDLSPGRHALAGLVALAGSAFQFIRSAPPERSSGGWSWPRPRSRRGRAPVAPVAAAPSWTGAAGRLAWLTYRQARAVWPAFALLGLGLPLWAWYGLGPLNPNDILGLTLLVNGLVAILAGVWVFGSEQPGRTYRFLAHQGVRPGLAWSAKVGGWLVALGALWLPGAALLRLWLLVEGYSRWWSRSESVALAVLLAAFAVAVLCGMAFRRTITAALLALVLVIPVAVVLWGLVAAGLLDWWWALFPTWALMAVGWAWSGPWMFDRPGAAKWVRLGGLLGGAAGGLFAAYVLARAFSLPAPGPLPGPLAASLVEASKPVPVAENAAPLYREALREYVDIAAEIPRDQPDNPPRPLSYGGMRVLNIPLADSDRAILDGWPVQDARLGDFLRAQGKTIELTREASARPRYQTSPLGSVNYFNQEGESLGNLARLVGLSAEERRARGDLAGAWDDLLVLFRMARQQSGPVSLVEAVSGRWVERQALGQAMRWAADPKQTPEQLRAALASYRAQPAPLPLDQSWAADEAIARQTLALPPDRLIDDLDRLASPREARGRSLAHRLIATPWERERARRALRLDLLHNLSQHRITGGNRRPFPPDPIGDARLAHALRSTPLAKLLAPSLASTAQSENQNEVGRRALVQVLALRAWQLSHGGRLPEKLEDLVPSELDRLPNDPFAGPTQPFGYGPASDHRLPVLGIFGDYIPRNDFREYPGRPMVLYSVGPVGVDPLTGAPVPWFRPDGRPIFPLADEPPRPMALPPGPSAERPGPVQP